MVIIKPHLQPLNSTLRDSHGPFFGPFSDFYLFRNNCETVLGTNPGTQQGFTTNI